MIISVLPAPRGVFIVMKSPLGDELTLSSVGAGIRDYRINGESLLLTMADDEAYLSSCTLNGKFVGPFLGRIDKGIPKAGYQLPISENGLCLHSDRLNTAFAEFGFQVDSDEVSFHYDLPEEAGVCPAISFDVKYRLLNDKHGYCLRAIVTPKQPFPLNVASHVYWAIAPRAEDHKLTIPSKNISRYDNRMIEIGIAKCPKEFDFSSGKLIGEDIAAFDKPPFFGLDHSFYDLSGPVRVEYGGKRIEILSSAKGIHLYTQNFSDPSLATNRGPLARHSAVAIEPSDGFSPLIEYDEQHPCLYEVNVTVTEGVNQ